MGNNQMRIFTALLMVSLSAPIFSEEADMAITGIVAGQPWSSVMAAHNPLDAKDDFSFVILAEKVDPAVPFGDLPMLLIVLDKKELGVHRLGDGASCVVLIPPADNLVCDSGFVEIVAIDTQYIILNVEAAYSDGSQYKLSGSVKINTDRQPPAP